MLTCHSPGNVQMFLYPRLMFLYVSQVMFTCLFHPWYYYKHVSLQVMVNMFLLIPGITFNTFLSNHVMRDTKTLGSYIQTQNTVKAWYSNILSQESTKHFILFSKDRFELQRMKRKKCQPRCIPISQVTFNSKAGYGVDGEVYIIEAYHLGCLKSINIVI